MPCSFCISLCISVLGVFRQDPNHTSTLSSLQKSVGIEVGQVIGRLAVHNPLGNQLAGDRRQCDTVALVSGCHVEAEQRVHRPHRRPRPPDRPPRAAAGTQTGSRWSPRCPSTSGLRGCFLNAGHVTRDVQTGDSRLHVAVVHGHMAAERRDKAELTASQPSRPARSWD